MFILKGKGVSEGIGKGPLHFVKRNTEEKYSANIQDEQGRLKTAVEDTLTQLKLATEIYSGNDTISQVLQVHSMLTEDVSFLTRINKILYEEECNAEYAVYQASQQISEELKQLPDNYLSERRSDVEDVAGRIISNLSEEKEIFDLLDTKAIIVADELLPSHILNLDKEKTLGVIFRKGSANSHAAILLRSLGIPAVFNVAEGLSEYYEGLYTCIDGIDGSIAILPDEETENEFDKRAINSFENVAYDEEDSNIKICCNINLPQDVDKVISVKASGIGLFRTEFLFLKGNELPTEDEQYEIYKDVISKLNGEQVAIRTLDIGADKSSVLLHNVNVNGDKTNDNGIRFCLNRPEIFKTQLTAIYKAANYGNVSIILPAVTNASEINKTKDICQNIKNELINKGYSVKDIPIGVMIETVEAVNNIAEIAESADFFSIGTNDLSLALLSPNNARNEWNDTVDNNREIVIEAIRKIVNVAKDVGIKVSVCGEMAADENMIKTFIEIGVNEISVMPSKVLKIRNACKVSF